MKRLRSKAPAWQLLHPDFPYVPAAKTDIRRTFAKARKERDKVEAERVQKVRRIKP